MDCIDVACDRYRRRTHVNEVMNFGSHKKWEISRPAENPLAVCSME